MPPSLPRILSGLVMIGLLILALMAGKTVSLVVVLVVGILVIDELLCNFLKRARFSLSYIFSQLLLILPYVWLNFTDLWSQTHWPLVLALAQNTLLLVYLFILRERADVVAELFKKKIPVLAGPFVLFPLLTVAWILQVETWKQTLGLLLVVTYGMDTMAWFVGKNFGRHKLWPSVSPKKTVEGLIGGAFGAGLLGTLYWTKLMGEKMTFLHFMVFLVLALTSQVGDLVQSKIKRHFHLKDSSSLIPGHGGVYDRIDSLLFVAPFYVSIIRWFYT